MVWNGTVQPQPGSCHTRYGEERGRWAQTRPGSGTTTTTPTTHGFALWSCVGDPSPPGLAWRHTRLHTGYALLTWYEGRGNGLTVHGVGVFGSEGCVGRQAGTVSWSWFLLWGADRQTDRQRVGDVTNAARRRTAHDGDDDDDDVPFPPVRLAEPPRDCPSRPFIKELNQQSGSRRGSRRVSGRDMATLPVGILFLCRSRSHSLCSGFLGPRLWVSGSGLSPPSRPGPPRRPRGKVRRVESGSRSHLSVPGRRLPCGRVGAGVVWLVGLSVVGAHPVPRQKRDPRRRHRPGTQEQRMALESVAKSRPRQKPSNVPPPKPTSHGSRVAAHGP